MLTGGFNDVVPATLCALKCYVMFIPHITRGIVTHNKMRYNRDNIYPPRRLNIRGEYIH